MIRNRISSSHCRWHAKKYLSGVPISTYHLARVFWWEEVTDYYTHCDLWCIIIANRLGLPAQEVMRVVIELSLLLPSQFCSYVSFTLTWERWWTVLLFHCRYIYILLCYNLFVLAQNWFNGMLRYILCDINDFILTPKWMTVIVFGIVYDDVSFCSSRKVRDRRYCRYDIIGSCVEAMWFSSRLWFWIAVYNVRYNYTSWCFFSDDIILFDLNWCALIAYNMLIRVCDGQLTECSISYVFSLFRTTMFYAC